MAPLLPAATALYLLFVVYGSLIPLDLHPRPLDEAWQMLVSAPWLQLDVGDRADWVANLLMYVPLGYLLTAWGAPPTSSVVRHVAVAIAVLATCAALAVAVEFAQVFFPPRTVSLNDIVAEWLGAALGIGLWWATGKKVSGLATTAQGRDRAGVVALLICYGLVYLLLSLFPYDFLVSAAELATKFSSEAYGLLVAPRVCEGVFRCTSKLGAEILAAAPLGALVWWAGYRTLSSGILRALLYGALLGLALEAAQFLTASGISQGASIATRAAGFSAGYFLSHALQSGRLERMRAWLRLIVVLAVPPYLFALGLANGLYLDHWRGWGEALERLNEVRFLPFYHYYYTSETHAMVSLIAITGLYAPVGAAAWAWAAARERSARVSVWLVALSGGALCAAFEFAKLFASEKRADPTDVLIAGVGAAIGFAIFQVPHYWLRQNVPTAGSTPISKSTQSEGSETHGKNRVKAAIGWKLLTLPAAVAVIVAAYKHPLGAAWLISALLIYAAILWRHPSAWLILLPAMLPLLDLAPWTGRFFLNEFDLFVLTTVTVAWWRHAGHARHIRVEALPMLLLVIASLSYFVSFLIGLFPLQPIDINSFSSYHSHYTALRSVKGVFWAFLLAPLLFRSWSRGTDVPKLFSIGMMIGLAAVVGFVFWERLTFSGLFNFAHEYRVTGPFSEMHTGGAYLEAYLVIALSFVGFIITTTTSLLLRLAGIVLYAGSTYAVLVTFSRGGYVAFGAVVLLLCASIVIHAARQRSQRLIVFAVPLVLMTVGLVAIPILEGPYVQTRFNQVKRDLSIREGHWRDSLRLMDAGGSTSLFGMGLGRFPETYFWKNSQGPRPANYHYATENGNTFLRLGSGDSLYLDQLIRLQPRAQYKISVDIRSTTPDAALTMTACEKALLDSFNCSWNNIAVGSSDGTWQHHQLVIDSNNVGAGHWFARRPTKLSLFNQKGVIDVDNVALIDARGENLVANGDFSRGNDYWFFATDNHLPWHIKNFWIHLYFEQGWLGVLSIATLVTLILIRRGVEMWAGAPFAGALVSSLVACLLVGTFDGVVDSPRLATLFWLLLFLAMATPVRGKTNVTERA